MNVDGLRIADKILGLPVCWVLTALRYLSKPFIRSSRLSPIEKILIIKLSEMGSTVLAYPAIMELKGHLPDAQIFFLVFSANRAVVEILGFTDNKNIVTVSSDGLLSTVTSGIGALLKLWKAKVNVTVDMDFFSRFSAIVAFLVCRGSRVGFHRFNDEGLRRGDLLTHKVIYSPHIHTSAAFLGLAKALFAPEGELVQYKGPIHIETGQWPSYSPQATDLESVKIRLESKGFVGGNQHRLVLVNTNASEIFPLRKWPLSRYVELCATLLVRRPDVMIALTGSRSEAPEAEFVATNVGSSRCVSLAGDTSFTELLALYSFAALLITNDSGPAHFASLLRLPTVVLFGPETPRLYGPFGEHCISLHAGFACSPCVSVYNAKKSPCKNSLCLKAISVEDVVSKSLTMIPE